MARFKWEWDALDPRAETEVEPPPVWRVGIEHSHFEALQRRKDLVRLFRLQLIPDVLKDPLQVFEGLGRPNQDEGLCYCGLPEEDHRGPDIHVPSPPGMVFCVYTTVSGKITFWDWEPADSSKPGCPEGWEKDRFRRMLWPEKLDL